MSLFSNGKAKLLAALRTAWRDTIQGALIVGRGAVGLVGVSALIAALALTGSEWIREQAISVALSATGSIMAEAEAGADDLRLDAGPASEHRGEWFWSKPTTTLEPAQEHITRYLARRYRVADNAVRRIVGEAYVTGRSIGLDPMLILAVTAVESSLNPFAQSPVGAQGLMQVMTRVHSEKFVMHGGDHAALDPIANLRVGSEILKDLIRRGGSVERGLQLYVGAGNLADDGGYAARVLGELGRIKLAATGGVRDALAAGLRAVEVASGSAPAESWPVGASGKAPLDSSSDSLAI